MAGLVEQPMRPASRASMPDEPAGTTPVCYLSPFDNLFAPVIAAWPQTAHELTWLAPGTVPPLTPSKVCAWQRADGRQYLFWNAAHPGPAGYAELNRMPDERRRYWIGHFILDPVLRGRGLSHTFFRNLVMHAFGEMGAAEVLLVVVPQNLVAIRCYERGGMIVSGRESKRFESTGRRHTFLRMSITRRRFERFDAYQESETLRTPFVRNAVSLLNRQVDAGRA